MLLSSESVSNSLSSSDDSLRRADCPLQDMSLAVLESNGEISIMKHVRE